MIQNGARGCNKYDDINDSHGNDMMISIIEQQIILVFFAKELFHSNFF